MARQTIWMAVLGDRAHGSGVILALFSKYLFLGNTTHILSFLAVFLSCRWIDNKQT